MQSTRPSMRHSFITAGLLLLVTTSVVADDAKFRRWAIIATPEVTETALPDLLTAQLSQDESVELVERERLREATRELQLAALIKAGNVEQRLQLGKTLGSDALMVVSIEERQGKRRLRVVVCGAKLGVRLWDGSFAFDGAELNDLVKQCATTVAEVRQRFANGIQHIVAVPPFLSQNFELGFAYLQSRYSERLSSALTAHAGVAVVELEEARAILRELEDTLTGGLDRTIATIVKGSYSATRADEQGQGHIDLKVELIRDQDDQQTINKRLQIGTAGHWLTTNLTKQLLSAAEQRPATLGRAAQKAILARHAQRFAELGDWERSMSLREAALVLDPNDALQRALLITEYQYTINPLLEVNWRPATFAKKLDPELRAAALQRAVSDYVLALRHFEYLIHNKLITQADAIGLFQTHRWYATKWVSDSASWDPLKHEIVGPACEAQRQFIKTFGPAIHKLPFGRKLPERFSKPFYGFQYPVTQHVLTDVIFNGYSAASLESLHDLIERVLPENAKASAYVLMKLHRSFATLHTADLRNYHDDLRSYHAKQQELRKKYRAAENEQTRNRVRKQEQALVHPKFQQRGPLERAARDDWLSFLRRLQGSERDVVKLYGHWGMLRESGEGQGAAAEIEALLPELKRRDLIGEWVLSYAKHGLGKAESPWADQYAARSKPVAVPSRDRAQFETITLRVTGENKSTRLPPIKGILKCGPDCDALWTKDRFFLMHKPGVLREIKLTDATGEHTLFWEVAWDGEYIWMHVHGQGIVAIRTDGNPVATFREPEIPGYWKGHKLVGLAPRKALMVGSFGEANRAWCAILQIDEMGQQSANVFFQAKFVPEGRSPEDAATNVEIAFRPDSLHQVRLKDGKGYAIVGRPGLPRMRIDLSTLNVTVPPPKEVVAGATTRTDLGFRAAVFLHEGHAFIPSSGLADLPTSKRMVFHDGWLYRPGYVWMRGRPETGQRERLHRNKLNHNMWNLRAGVSAHYGVVAYNPWGSRVTLFRVNIVDDADANSNGEER